MPGPDDTASRNPNSVLSDRAPSDGFRSRVARGGLAIIDQATFAGANFALTLLLGRWLSPEGYGAFSLSYAIFLYVFMIYSPFFLDPMSVFAAGRHRTDRMAYFREILRAHVLFALGASAACLAASVAIASAHPLLSASFLAFAAAAPVLLSVWLLRRACYAFWTVSASLWSGLCYFAVLALGVYLTHQAGMLSAFSAPLIVGAAGIASCAAMVGQFWRHLFARTTRVRGVLADHWRFGRWAAGSAIFAWVPGNLGILLLSFMSGLAESAAYRAVTILLLPLMQTAAALVPAYMPTLVKQRHHPDFRRRILYAAAAAAFAGVAYAAFLSFTGKWLVALAFSGKYDQFSAIIPVLALSAPFYLVCMVFAAALQALERTDRSFLASVITTVLMSLVSLVAVPYLGALGAALGWLAGTVISSICLGIMIRQLVRLRSSLEGPLAGLSF